MRASAQARPMPSFDEFVQARSPGLFRTALLLTGQDRAEAEDLLQLALERAYRHWARISSWPAAASRSRARPREIWLLMVPTLRPRRSAISASFMSSKYRSTSAARCRGGSAA